MSCVKGSGGGSKTILPGTVPPLCRAFQGPRDKRDLPAPTNSQYWSLDQGGRKIQQGKQLKNLEKKSIRMRQADVGLSLYDQIFREMVRGTIGSQ